jgi:hypothetical protein
VKLFLVALSIGVGVVMSGCAVGEPLETTAITNSGATLNGNVYSSFAGDTDVWWKYGETTAYDSETRHGQVAIADEDPHPVSMPLQGLAAATDYHFQLCAQDQEEDPGRIVCSKDQTFTTQQAGTLSCPANGAFDRIFFATDGGAPVSENLTCTAAGGYVTIGDTAIGGADQGSFSASDACSGVALQPGASCTFSVTFQPVTATDYRDYLANLTVHHDGTNDAESVGLDGDNSDTCC